MIMTLGRAAACCIWSDAVTCCIGVYNLLLFLVQRMAMHTPQIMQNNRTPPIAPPIAPPITADVVLESKVNRKHRGNIALTKYDLISNNM